MNDKVENTENVEKPRQNTEHTNQNTSQFNWVTERSSCSLPKIFKDLRAQVEQDITARNGIRPKNSPYEFSVVDKDADFLAVLHAKVEGKDVQKSVTFSLAEHAILVRDSEGTQMFEVTLSFNDKGECKLFVKEEKRESWQVRRMALEDLLFKGY